MATPKIRELIENIASLLPTGTEGIKDDFKDNLKENNLTNLIGSNE